MDVEVVESFVEHLETERENAEDYMKLILYKIQRWTGHC